jgi:hypothetical protein
MLSISISFVLKYLGSILLLSGFCWAFVTGAKGEIVSGLDREGYFFLKHRKSYHLHLLITLVLFFVGFLLLLLS